MRLSLMILLSLSACAVVRQPPSEQERYFTAEVKPVLQERCLQCHNGTVPQVELDLTSKAAAFKRSAAGRAWIVPGRPDSSLLISAVQRGGTHPRMMPRTEVSLTEDQIGALREWIEDGAYWPEGEEGVLKAVQGLEGF